MDTYYVDGRFVPAAEAVIPVRDIAVLRGFGVFDFLITYNRKPFHLTDHVERLQRSAREIGLKIRHTTAEICDIVEETIRRNPHLTDANVRIVCSGGVSSDGLTPEGNGILMVLVTPRQILPPEWYTDGAGIITVEIERFIPLAKSTNYLSAVYAVQQARQQGAIEAVYVDRRNRILEGTTTNFFLFRGDTLVTPGSDILPGITRQVVRGLVQDHFAVEVRDVFREEVAEAAEVFITASNKEIVPVVTVDGNTVGTGRPGERTRKVMALFREETERFAAVPPAG